MRRGTEHGGKAESGVRAQRAKTASPDRRGGVGADEIPLAWLEELPTGDLRSPRGLRARANDQSWTIYAG